MDIYRYTFVYDVYSVCVWYVRVCVRACVRVSVSVRLSLGVFVQIMRTNACNHALCTHSCTHIGSRVQGLGLGSNTYGTCHNRRVIPTHVHVDHAAAARSRLSSQVTPCAERLSLTRMHGTGEDDHGAREWP